MPAADCDDAPCHSLCVSPSLCCSVSLTTSDPHYRKISFFFFTISSAILHQIGASVEEGRPADGKKMFLCTVEVATLFSFLCALQLIEFVCVCVFVHVRESSLSSEVIGSHISDWRRGITVALRVLCGWSCKHLCRGCLKGTRDCHQNDVCAATVLLYSFKSYMCLNQKRSRVHDFKNVRSSPASCVWII